MKQIPGLPWPANQMGFKTKVRDARDAFQAHGDAYHRAVMNTYISLLGSTVATFVVSSFFGE